MANQMREAERRCVRAGLTIDKTHKHPRVVDPATGRYVTYSSTPGCPHAGKNMLSDVRKYLKVEV